MSKPRGLLISLMMEAGRTSETVVSFYQATRHYNPEDSPLHTRRRKNLKSYRKESSVHCVWNWVQRLLLLLLLLYLGSYSGIAQNCYRFDWDLIPSRDSDSSLLRNVHIFWFSWTPGLCSRDKTTGQWIALLPTVIYLHISCTPTWHGA
jgi:hypothetical protein